MSPEESLIQRLRRRILGEKRSPTDPGVFQRLTLVAFLAWVGLGADGVSSANYGPHEAFLALGGHTYLAILLALMTAATVFIISASYKHIIELFPGGGGGYLVASRLLSPKLGMVSGCALLVDYVLTVTVSVSSGADAVFSFFPIAWQPYKLVTIYGLLLLLMIMNLRGVKESVTPIVIPFLLFIVTHTIVILFSLFSKIGHIPAVIGQTTSELGRSVSQMGFFGVFLLLMRAFSLGGGTFTGIEAVSNGLPVLREPRVETGKRAMTYIAVSLAFMAGGLLICYLLFGVGHEPGKTLNAVLLGKVAGGWPAGKIFIAVALFSEALILLVAAQTGFLDGPRVLANMALDNWMPGRFALISDRLVTQNGILIMGLASGLLLWISKGSVAFLVVLYSINVFFTFTMSQLGMVKHWWQVRRSERRWLRSLAVNGVGLIVTFLVLIMVIVLKFHQGGWLTLVVTTSLVIVSILVKRHYRQTFKLLGRLDILVESALPKNGEERVAQKPFNRSDNTAVILVNGFTGMGLHTLFTAYRNFHGHFKNFVFLQVGIIDAGQFKGHTEIENLEAKIKADLQKYVDLMQTRGYHASSLYALGTDVVEEVEKIAIQAMEEYPNNVLFAGQLVFPKETIFTRILHNYTAFAIQKRLYYRGVSVVILPIRV